MRRHRMINGYAQYVLLICDAVTAAVAYPLACWLSLGGDLPATIRLAVWQGILWVAAGRTLVSVTLGGGRLSWRYADIVDLSRILLIGTSGSVFVAIGLLQMPDLRFPVGIIVTDWLLSMAFLGASRYGLRVILASRMRVGPSAKRILVVGAGDAGVMLVREMRNNTSLGYVPVGFLDDDPRKVGLQIHRVRVLGSCADLPEVARDTRADAVVLAIPSAAKSEFERILAHVRASRLPFKTLPPTRDILDGYAHLRQLRPVQIEDLLGREPTRIDTGPVRRLVGGRRVLITGAAGSIGSELARQIAAFEPELLVILDRNETDLYSVELGLRRAYPHLRLLPSVADILDRTRVSSLLDKHRPQIVFHAAAYKHVPVMEANPSEAVKVNVLGTALLVELLKTYGTEVLVFISTDKAVEPVNVMGMTKRLGEMIVLALSGGIVRPEVVRFGNVLASNGSVVPLFQRQIAEGGPVTVTHPEVTRYFMTIPEAVQLVLMAASLGRGGEIFVLDMGKPVKILNLARQLIQLSGLEPERDIRIEFVGLRPGEKLHEELVGCNENLVPTAHEKIRVIHPNGPDPQRIAALIGQIRQVAQCEKDEDVTQQLKQIVAELHGDRHAAHRTSH